jgi:hypothetical protein
VSTSIRMPWKALVATLAFAAMLSSLSTGEFNKGFIPWSVHAGCANAVVAIGKLSPALASCCKELRETRRDARMRHSMANVDRTLVSVDAGTEATSVQFERALAIAQIRMGLGVAESGSSPAQIDSPSAAYLAGHESSPSMSRDWVYLPIKAAVGKGWPALIASAALRWAVRAS